MSYAGGAQTRRAWPKRNKPVPAMNRLPTACNISHRTRRPLDVFSGRYITYIIRICKLSTCVVTERYSKLGNFFKYLIKQTVTEYSDARSMPRECRVYGHVAVGVAFDAVLHI